MSTAQQDTADAWATLHHASSADMVGIAVGVLGAVVGSGSLLALGLLVSAVALGVGMQARARAGDTLGNMWTGTPELTRGFSADRDWLGRVMYKQHGDGRYAYVTVLANSPTGQTEVSPDWFTGKPANPLDKSTYAAMPLYERLLPPDKAVALKLTNYHKDVVAWTETWPERLLKGGVVLRSWDTDALVVPLADWEGDQWVLQQSKMQARRRGLPTAESESAKDVIDGKSGRVIADWHPVSFYPDWAPSDQFDIRYPAFSSRGKDDLQRVWIPVVRETGAQRL